MKKIAYALSILLMVSLLGCGASTVAKETATPTPTPTPTATEAPSANGAKTANEGVSNPNAVIPPGAVSTAKMNAIKVGMTYEQVEEIIGAPGKKEIKDANTTTYQFAGGVPKASDALVTFVDGKATEAKWVHASK